MTGRKDGPISRLTLTAAVRYRLAEWQSGYAADCKS
ncbi:uncharacterized protein METZ01_LOCUS194567, partial [marine metagenome]